MRAWSSWSAVRSGDDVTHVASSTAATVVRPNTSSPLAIAVAGLILVLAAFLFIDGRVWGSTQQVTSPASHQSATKQTTTTTTTRNTASDGLLEALLGTGGALLVFGLAYGRITSITLPGGVVVALSADEDKTLSDAVDKQTTQKPSEKSAVLARARADALGAKQRKAQSSVALSDQELADIAQRAAADR